MTLVRLLLVLIVIIALLFIVRPDDSVTASFVARAEQYRATFDYRLASDYLRLAITRQPWNATLHLRLSEAALDQHRFDEATQYLDQAGQLGASPIGVATIQAELAERTNRFGEAAADWQSIAQVRGADADYRRWVNAHINAEQWNEAQAAAEQWLKHAPDSPAAHLALAKVIALDDPIGAKDHFNRVPADQAEPFVWVLDDPDRAVRSMLLGRAYLSQNDLALAARAFNAAIEANPAYAEAYAYAGFVADQSGDDGQALLDRAVALDRDLIVARYFRARHLWAHGDLDGALSDLQYAIERDPQNALIAAELGRVYTQRSDFASAEKWLTNARDLKPDDPLGWKALAELYVGRVYGSREQAIDVAQQAVSLAPDDAEAWMWLGLAHLLNDQRGEAEQDLHQAIALNPHLAAAHLHLGRLYGRDTDAGRSEYERALALDPAGPIGQQAKRTLELP
jgi:tetratricopeptide (TPR) repeat protein